MAFPSLTSCSPSVTQWEEEFSYDFTISSDKEGGYRETRARFTRNPLDKITLRNYERQMLGGATAFNWTNPDDAVTYEVRFLEPIKYSAVKENRWKVELTVETT
jgi:hypothetical protein